MSPNPGWGRVLSPYTSASALLPGDPPWGAPLQGMPPLHFDPLMTWGPAEGPRRLVEVHSDPGGRALRVMGRLGGGSPSAADFTDLPKEH